MPVEFRGVSTASLGDMLKGYGVMAGLGAAWPQARFWWTPVGALAADIPRLADASSEAQRHGVRTALARLLDWANNTGRTFAKADGSEAPLKDPSVWAGLDPEAAVDAEAVGGYVGRAQLAPNPVLGSWGQAIGGRANQFNTLRESALAASRTPDSDIDCAVFDDERVPKGRLKRGGGALFPEGIKRYATGVGPGGWIHEKKKPLGNWDYILAIRGLLLLRGASRLPRGSRRAYPAFPFVLPGSVVRAQGSTVPTQEVFLPTWNGDRPRTLAEFRAQVRGFQARVGRRDFASGAADFRRAVVGRGTTGAFAAFHRFALEPRKPGQRSPQTQAVARGPTTVGPVGPAVAVRNSLRLLLAPLDDSGWLERFRLKRTGGGVLDTSARLAFAKARFDDAIHAAIEAPVDTRHIAVLRTLWELQLTLWRVSERSGSGRRNGGLDARARSDAGSVPFEPAPLLQGRAWGSLLSELLRQSAAARLGWALASLGWASVWDGNGEAVRKPVVEQLLPVVASDDRQGLRVPDSLPRQRVPQPGRNPAREIATLLWRRWIDTVGLPVLPGRGTRPADAGDAIALLRGDVSVGEVQRYFLAFLPLDGSGDAPPPAPVDLPTVPAYAALRLWFDLATQGTPDDRRPLDGAVPRGVATGTERSVASACHAALRRLRIHGLPGDGPPDARPRGKSVAHPDVGITPRQAGLMAAAVLVPVSDESVARLAGTLLVPSNSREPERRSAMEIVHG